MNLIKTRILLTAALCLSTHSAIAQAASCDGQTNTVLMGDKFGQIGVKDFKGVEGDIITFGP